ncbi:MAG: hypothetical protein LC708_03605, partial [Actinobacteria bacterium]|nr:hypothetical protein [Actinomycetota bacterium]
DLQATKAAGGTVVSWLSKPLEAVTISGTVTVNLRGRESATAANAGRGILIERCDNAGAVLSTIVPNSAHGTEFTTSDAANASWTFTPTSTALAAGQRIKVTVKVRNVGTMGGSRTVTYTVDGPTSGAAGDTWVRFTETIVERPPDGRALVSWAELEVPQVTASPQTVTLGGVAAHGRAGTLVAAPSYAATLGGVRAREVAGGLAAGHLLPLGAAWPVARSPGIAATAAYAAALGAAGSRERAGGLDVAALVALGGARAREVAAGLVATPAYTALLGAARALTRAWGILAGAPSGRALVSWVELEVPTAPPGLTVALGGGRARERAGGLTVAVPQAVALGAVPSQFVAHLGRGPDSPAVYGDTTYGTYPLGFQVGHVLPLGRAGAEGRASGLAATSAYAAALGQVRG